MSKFKGSQKVDALVYDAGSRESFIITIPATADATQADYLMIYDDEENSTALWIDIDADGTEPTGALYVGSDSQITGGIATADTDIEAATKIFTALDGNVANMSFIDNLDGTISASMDNIGNIDDPAPKNADDSDVGSITVVVTDGGSVGGYPNYQTPGVSPSSISIEPNLVS